MTDTRRKIVPVEASEEMADAGGVVLPEYAAPTNGHAIDCYEQMLAAAPDASEDDEFVRALESAAHKAIMECNAFDPQSQAKAVTSAILKIIEGEK